MSVHACVCVRVCLCVHACAQCVCSVCVAPMVCMCLYLIPTYFDGLGQYMH